MMSEGTDNVEIVVEDLKALASDSKVDHVSPVNWDEVPKKDSNGQIPNTIGAEIDTHEEVGRPIVVYDDSDNEEEIQNGSENGVAIDNLPNVQGDGEPGDEGMTSDKEDRQSSRKSSLSEVTDARFEADNELAQGNLCCDDHNIPVNTNGEAGEIEDTFKPITTVEVKTEIINGVELDGEVVCCERHDTPINDFAENENETNIGSNAEAEVIVEKAPYSGEISGYPMRSEPDLEMETEAPNSFEEPRKEGEESGSNNAEKVDIDLGDPEVERAATKIQAIFKGHQTRKDVKEKTTAEASDKDDNKLVGPEEKGETEKLEFMSVKLRTRTWEQEKNYNNVDVLKSIADEVDGDEGDLDRVKKLISWAKSSKKTKTETMKVREKNKIDSMRQAVDPHSLSMVIEEKGKGADGPAVVGAAPSKGKKFEVRRLDSGANFQVRKHSAILPQSETVVTKDWIQSAVKLHEQEADVTVTDMSFKKDNDMYYASISAKVAGREKAYNWVIRVNPTEVDTNYNAKDKETFMVSELGKKIAEFVTRIKSQQGKMSVPFRPVIYADARYAILDNLQNFAQFRDDTGFDLEHMKIALKGLAKLHAMTYAYFNRGSDNLQNFAQTLKLMVNRHYQPSSAKEDIDAKKKELALKFEYLLEVVRSTDAEGARLADAAAAKYGSGDFLYNIFKVSYS